MQAKSFRPLPLPRLSFRSGWMLGILVVAVVVAGVVTGQTAAGTAPAVSRVPAPTKLYQPPDIFDTVALPGDFASMRYSVGQLDRAARLQFRLDPQLRAYSAWLDSHFDITVQMLTRAHWEEARLAMPYGVPVRVGRTGLAAPAEADDRSQRLWNSLGVTLPAAAATTFRGQPQRSPSLVMADYLCQLLAAEIVVDQTGLAGNKQWVRGLMTHLVLVTYLQRKDEQSLRDLDLFFRQVSETRRPKSLAASDYHPDVDLGDWLWFQAHFYAGAEILFEREGRSVLKDMQKLRKRNDDLLTESALLAKYGSLSDWFYASFSAVSTRPAR